MADLDAAINIANRAHAGQKDKAGQPYILHPLRVMFAMESRVEQIVAVMHDVVEDDARWSLDRIRDAGFSEEVISALDYLTRRSQEPYEDYIERVAVNDLARRVKLADLADNLSPKRLSSISDKLVRRYLRAQTRLSPPNPGEGGGNG